MNKCSNCNFESNEFFKVCPMCSNVTRGYYKGCVQEDFPNEAAYLKYLRDKKVSGNLNGNIKLIIGLLILLSCVFYLFLISVKAFKYGILILVLLAIPITLLIILLFKQIKLKNKYLNSETKGKVIDYRYYELNPHRNHISANYVIYPIIEFEVDGRKYRVRSRAKLYGNHKGKLKNKDIKGLEVRVLYDDIDPTDAVVLLDKETLKDIRKVEFIVHKMYFYMLILIVIILLTVLYRYFL